MNHRMLDVNRDSHPNADRGAIGVLGVDWSEGNLGELQSLTELLQQQVSTTTVRHLTYSHCLGRATEVTPVNVYRRMRIRCRQIENTMQGLGSSSSSSSNVQEITVRFTITTRQGTQATVETLHASPTAMGPQFSPRLRDYLLRNQLVHQAIALAEPEQDNNNTLLEQDNHHCRNDDDTHHATWGRAVIRLVEMRDLDISASALFTLVQKCPDYIPAGTVVPQRSKPFNGMAIYNRQLFRF